MTEYAALLIVVYGMNRSRDSLTRQNFRGYLKIIASKASAMLEHWNDVNPSYFRLGLGPDRCDSKHLDTMRVWGTPNDVLHSPYFGCTVNDVTAIIYRTNPLQWGVTDDVLIGQFTDQQENKLTDKWMQYAETRMTATDASAAVLATIWCNRIETKSE